MKSTSKQQAALVNDETAPGYTVLGVDAGYTFANYGLLKRPKLTNVSNITNKQYRNPSSQAILNTTALPGAPAGTLRYYLGAALCVGHAVGRHLNCFPVWRRFEVAPDRNKCIIVQVFGPVFTSAHRGI